MLEAWSLSSILRNSRRCTESLVFYLHYRVTFLALLFCCILVSTEQFVGEKIQCLSKSSESNREFLNNYCWAASTYSVTTAYLKEIGVNIPHAGVYGSENQAEYEYRNFYQYVHIVLFIQAILFYIPHALWKSIEQNSISNLPVDINNIKTGRKSITGTTSESPFDSIAIYIEDRWGSHKSLVFKYLACEILAAINVLVQINLLDIFFHGKFLNMGLLLEAYYNTSILKDPLQLFPLVTVCNFRRYGPSGYIDEINSLCVLPVNAINGKIFLCIWIWFTVLMLLSLASIVHLLLSIMIPVYRLYILKIDYYTSFSCMKNCSYLKLIELSDCGDWFVLTSIKKNTDKLNYCRLTENILSRINSLDIELKEETEITDA